MVFALAAAAVLLAATPQAQGQGTFLWNALPSGDWATAIDWAGGIGPTGSDNAYIFNGGTANITTALDAAPGAAANYLSLGDSGSTTSGAVLMSGGSLTVANVLSLGNLGQGTFTQTGGTANVTFSLSLGNGTSASSGVGVYYLTAGSLGVGTNEYIGNTSAGTLSQTGGTNNLVGSIEFSDSGQQRGFQRHLHPQRHGNANR